MHLKIARFIIFTLIGLSNLAALAQKQTYIDSLQKKLVTANDSQKVGIYNGLSWATKFRNPQQAFEYANKAHQLSIALENNVGKAISLNRMGAAKLKLGELNRSLAYILKALEISKSNNQPRTLATSLRQIGEVYEAQGNTPEAMKYYYNALSIADSIGKPIGIARSAIKVAGMYIKLKKYNNANQYLDYVINVFKEDSFLRGLHQAHVLKGDYFYKQNMPDSALVYYTGALIYLEQLEDRYGFAITTSKIANVYNDKGEFEKAMEGYYKALDIFIDIQDKKAVTHTYVVLAQVYANSNNYIKGIDFGKKALAQAKALSLSNEEKEANFVLYTIFKEVDNQSKAILYLEGYMHLMDSLKHGEESWRVDQMRQSYDLEIQLKENELNTAVINNQALEIKNNMLLRNFLIVLIVIIILLASIIWYALTHAKKVNKQLVLANEEKNEAISLISHDLKSPFNKIKGLTQILELELKEADTSTQDLLAKLKMVSHEGLTLVQNLVDIKALNSGSYVIKYINFDLNDFLINRVQGFEQIAKSKNITLNFSSINRSFHIYSDKNSIARIFDNVLSNAIKFSPPGDSVEIKCTKIEDQFTFSIADNGIGIKKEDIDEIFGKYKTGMATPTGNELSSGLGLTIVASLINKLNGSIKCVSEPNKGAEFIVSIPLNQKRASD